MQNAQYIFFDLDGTLTDPGLGITNSVLYALERMGAPKPPRAELYRFIGPPLLYSFTQYCGFSPAEAREAVAHYRVYFTDRGIFENKLYPAVPGLLRRLRAGGKRLVMATSKPEEFAKTIAAHFGFAADFDRIVGCLMDETRTEKAEVIAYALEALGAAPERCVMVGDREHDILGAHRNGLPAVGVLYGYGSRDELLAAGAEALAETPDDVAALLL